MEVAYGRHCHERHLNQDSWNSIWDIVQKSSSAQINTAKEIEVGGGTPVEEQHSGLVKSLGGICAWWKDSKHLS